ncbi:N-6 DNA methylase [Paenibacillus sp. FSL W7-1332]|uniref:N-6 DNA methylase n=1 Tax=Paenibacillus sp. FSL W7-1332 TaxID=2921702 RepID=UPI0030D11A08
MAMEKLTLVCPIRGVLKATKRSKDGLSPSEEYARVEAIKYLIKQGYPKENFKIEAVIKKFGNSGRNSFRADFIVLDKPISSISNDIDELLKHALLLCEVKKNNNNFDYVKNTQVKPMLDFALQQKVIGLYWDNIEQRIFWQEWIDGKKEFREGALALLPKFGMHVNVKPITIEDTKPSDSLLDVFGRIEDILHQASIDPEQRYEVILQLILAKLFDEHGHYGSVNPLEIQDYKLLGYKDDTALEKFNAILGRAITYYEKHLPKRISPQINVKPAVLTDILKILAPIKLTASKRNVVQTFYMKFAKDLYRWDLAQFFTPTTVTDFIIDVLNPQFGEHIKDPACGSADFLTAAFHKGRVFDPNYADCIWGADNSLNAVQVSVLNMLLNGDGKTHISHEDSLENVNKYKDKFDILVCNPPFGTRIIEKRKEILNLFDLGHNWVLDSKNKKLQKTIETLKSQEAGILFIEVCIKQTKPGGRIAIILPNGYLGNRSMKYQIIREYMLRFCKIVSICSFPRFTFKTSGADVSASVVFLEKRETPLTNSSDDADYDFNVEMIQNVGWDVGNKRAEPVYRRNEEDGSFIINNNGERIIDADFDLALEDLRNSDVAIQSPWLLANDSHTGEGWSVSIGDVLKDETLTLDPKRYCSKYYNLREEIKSQKHVRLGDIVEVIPQLKKADGKSVAVDSRKKYKYIEIQDIGYGEYRSVEYRGWELPDRAKHFAEPGDLYIGSIWGSVQKWCLIGPEADNYVVTNGCYRLRVIPGKENYLLDLIVTLSTELYATQMRALARGSDGLAEVAEVDLINVLIPVIEDKERRELIQPFVDNLLSGKQSLKNLIETMVENKDIEVPSPPKRPNHTVLV